MSRPGISGLQHFQGDSLRLIHLPVHASWLNQVEIYFSVVQRKVVSPNDFHNLDEVEARLPAVLRTDRHTVRMEIH